MRGAPRKNLPPPRHRPTTRGAMHILASKSTVVTFADARARRCVLLAAAAAPYNATARSHPP